MLLVPRALSLAASHGRVRLLLLGTLAVLTACSREAVEPLGTVEGTVDSVAVHSLTLMDADRDVAVSGFDPIPEGAVINLALLPTRRLNIRANTSPSTVGSLRFGLDGKASHRLENVAPYALAGDSNGNYYAWTPSLGAHTVTATAYTGGMGSGTASAPLSRSFQVIDEAPGPQEPTADAGTGEPSPVPDAGSEPQPEPGTGGELSGELKVWHRVTLSLAGPQSSEAAVPNPFRDYRLNVTFSQGERSYTVPGYYAADGRAAESGAESGDVWRAHFVPDAVGTWTYQVSFRAGTDVAVSLEPQAGVPVSGLDGKTGTFTVAESDKAGRDHRGHGLLRYVGERYLQFAGSKRYFLKGGADSPENFLAYAEFDQTPPKHFYAPHAGHFRAGDPTWRGGKGKNIIGALNYLSGKGMNSVYFLTMNVLGDGRDVWPWTGSSVRDRFDVSKLDQWEVVFSHMDKLGLMLHVVTQETENERLLDGGVLGVQRKLYYRELVARFGHHLALVWNLGEENNGNTDAERKEFASYLRAQDPYDHPIVVHTYPGDYEVTYRPLLGFPAFEGPSLQMGDAKLTHAETLKWVNASAQASRPWVVTLDEIGPANSGVLPDANDPAHDLPRKYALWGNLMAGGGGVEWYFGYSYPNDDLDCEDWSSRSTMWDQTRHALEFFQQYLPFSRMRSADALTPATDDHVLALPGHTYAVYLPNGGPSSLDLGTSAGTFQVRWYDPRNGGALQQGTVTSVTGPGQVSLGQPPSSATLDWVCLVTSGAALPDEGGSEGGAGSTPPPDDKSGTSSPLEVTSFTLIDADTDLPVAGFDPIPAGAVLRWAELPTTNLNVRANVSSNVASVRFDLDGNPSFRVESAAPFALAGDTGGNYHPWTPGPGTHTLGAIPYSGSNASGTAGPRTALQFTLE